MQSYLKLVNSNYSNLKSILIERYLDAARRLDSLNFKTRGDLDYKQLHHRVDLIKIQKEIRINRIEEAKEKLIANLPVLENKFTSSYLNMPQIPLYHKI
ncbi:MAG: hypothetical protein H7296_10875 [Bacteroidia bacterium]|nr:hypothetical protein [Bacteroidia bacterium]